MRIDFLREFIYLAKSLNFTQTANQLHMSQPVLSKHITLLEEELNAKLFFRNKHVVKLTREGEKFLEDARGIVNQYDHAVNRLKAAHANLAGELNVGTLYGAMRNLLPVIAKRLERENPNLRLKLYCYEYGDLMDDLKYDKIDIALTMDLDASVYERYNVEKIYDDSFCVALHREHPLANYQNLTTRDIQDYDFVMASPSHMGVENRNLENYLNSKGVELKVVNYYREANSLCLYVETGDVMAFAPGHLSGYRGDNIRYIPFENGGICCDIVAVWKKDKHSPGITRFIRAIHAVQE